MDDPTFDAARRRVLAGGAAAGAGLMLGACGGPRSARSAAADDEPISADLVVVGGTSAGITTALEAAAGGASVVLLEAGRVLGGMSSAGLGFSDTGRKEVIGGLAREYYGRVYRAYEDDACWRWQARADFGNRGQGTVAIDGDRRTMWLFEPSVARSIFEDWIASSPVRVELGAVLDRTSPGVFDGERLTEIRTTDGRRFRARVFVDATYEGDLIELAHLPFVVGRESNAEFGETLNGVQAARALKNQFPPGVDPWIVAGDRDSGLLPGLRASLPPDGSADLGVQAYCFRLALTDVAANRLAVAPPVDYDERDHELLFRSIEAGQQKNFLTLDLMPNRKTDSNNWNGASSDFVGQNHDYPLASDAERLAIVARHERWQRGHLWTLQNHERVPAAIRRTHAAWGLAADEYTETGGWPHAVYVREGRRLRSDFVQTERHVRGQLPVEQPIAMGSYNMDSHNVWRHVGADGTVRNEGDVQERLDAPYGIDLGTVLPPRGATTNVLTPTAVSATHIAFGSIRMEPVFMALGQACGAIALQVLERDGDVQDTDHARLRKRLLERGAVLVTGDQRG
jgi:hypothetical protein